MVISINEMILDLTTPLIENSSYKNPSQREAWGYIYYSTILPDYSEESSWRTFFLRGKMRLDSEPNIPYREALP